MVLKNTTFNLPDDLVAKAKSYAANHGTTLTAIVREHLETVTAVPGQNRQPDPLVAFSDGRISKEQAVQTLGLRDYAELLVQLGEANLPLPALPAHEIENQATTFARIWRQS